MGYEIKAFRSNVDKICSAIFYVYSVILLINP